MVDVVFIMNGAARHAVMYAQVFAKFCVRINTLSLFLDPTARDLHVFWCACAVQLPGYPAWSLFGTQAT